MIEPKNTTALKKLQALKSRVKIIRGGSSAGKTVGILCLLINEAIENSGKVISVVTATVPALRRGCLQDFLQIMKSLNRFDENKFNRTLLKYTFSNGSYIEFFSTDDSSKLRGARRTTLFCNEANTITFSAYQELAIRTTESIWLDYNPVTRFWVDKELIGQDDTDFITLTYKDNNKLSENIVKELEKAREKAKTSTYWSNWVRVYLDGMTGSLEGAVIPNWKEIDTIPNETRLLGYGMDFGYSIDPTTLIALYKWNNAFIFDEVLYKTNMLNRDISIFLTQNNITQNIIADSAEPKSISELQRYGHSVFGVTKGRDSVVYGLNLINQNEIYITSRSLNLKRELQGYVWARDKEGNQIQKPCGEHPDCIDAMRYVVTDTQQTNRGEYHIW